MPRQRGAAAEDSLFAKCRGRSDDGLDNDLWCEGHGRHFMLNGYSCPPRTSHALTAAHPGVDVAATTVTAWTFQSAWRSRPYTPTGVTGARRQHHSLQSTDARMPPNAVQGTAGPSPRGSSVTRPRRPGPVCQCDRGVLRRDSTSPRPTADPMRSETNAAPAKDQALPTPMVHEL
jgi:hypothetical protein